MKLLIIISLLFASCMLSASEVKKDFDVPAGQFIEILQESNFKQGGITCQITFNEIKQSDSWSPSFNINIASADEKVVTLAVSKGVKSGYAFSLAKRENRQNKYHEQFLGLLAEDNVVKLKLVWEGNMVVAYGLDSKGQHGKSMLYYSGFQPSELTVFASSFKGNSECNYEKI